MKKAIFAVAALAVLGCSSSVRGQTTQLQQTAAGPNCHTYGCINTPLANGELFTWSDTSVSQKLSFRGLNYFMTVTTSGNVTKDLSSAAYENNGFAVHTDFDIDCFRCVFTWDDGYLQLNNEYVGSDPYLYGYNGQINVTSGTGQVGLVTPSPGDLIVNLVSGDATLIQVPSQVTILAGSLDADFTITSTAPTAPPSQTLSIIVTATFPDGTVATMKVTVQPVPAPPPTPDDSTLRD